jgi:V8-like Glu-specific endopeptidase
LPRQPRSAACGTFQYRAYDATVRRNGRTLYHVDDTYHGHSGSPVWVRRHPSMGGRVLVAVHVAGGSKANEAVLIDDEILKFIIANTK